MKSSQPDVSPSHVAKLQTDLAHQQHAFDALNQVVIEQAKLLDALQRRVKRLEVALQDLQHQVPGEARDIVAEKPPHY